MIQATKIYKIVDEAVAGSYTTISAQGSSRSSKTYNILIFLIVYCLQNSGTRLSIVRATLPALKGSIFIDFKEILHRMNIFDETRLNKTELTYEFPNGSWVEFFSTDSEQKLRGRKRDVLFVNEANELKYIEWQQLKMRTTRLTILDYNPSFTDDHWICDVNKDESTFHFISTYKDNPFLEKTIIDEIESLQRKNESLWKIYGLGIQAQIEGLIFPNIEIIDAIPTQVNMNYIGIDFGFTNDPTAIVNTGIYDNGLYVDELCYRTYMLTSDIIQELKQNAKGKRTIAESADPRLIQEIRNAGINIRPVQKGKGSVLEGISKMLEYKIYITKSSTNIIKEFKNYTYGQDNNGKLLNEPIDAFNHAIDAIRYVILETVLGRNRKKQDVSGLFGY